MKIRYDKEVDAAYIYLEYPIKDGEAKKTVKVKEDINMDFDDKGKLLGVEVLNASRHLSKELILSAQRA